MNDIFGKFTDVNRIDDAVEAQEPVLPFGGEPASIAPDGPASVAPTITAATPRASAGPANGAYDDPSGRSVGPGWSLAPEGMRRDPGEIGRSCESQAHADALDPVDRVDPFDFFEPAPLSSRLAQSLGTDPESGPPSLGDAPGQTAESASQLDRHGFRQTAYAWPELSARMPHGSNGALEFLQAQADYQANDEQHGTLSADDFFHAAAPGFGVRAAQPEATTFGGVDGRAPRPIGVSQHVRDSGEQRAAGYQRMAHRLESRARSLRVSAIAIALVAVVAGGAGVFVMTSPWRAADTHGGADTANLETGRPTDRSGYGLGAPVEVTANATGDGVTARSQMNRFGFANTTRTPATESGATSSDARTSPIRAVQFVPANETPTSSAPQNAEPTGRVVKAPRPIAPKNPVAYNTQFGTIKVAAGDENLKLYFDTRSLNAPIANPVHQATFDLVVPAGGVDGALFPLRIEPRHRLGELSAVLISGLPGDAVLSAGTRLSADAWGLLPGQLDGLRLWLGESEPKKFKLEVHVFQPNGLLAGRSELIVRRGAILPADGALPRPQSRSVPGEVARSSGSSRRHRMAREDGTGRSSRVEQASVEIDGPPMQLNTALRDTGEDFKPVTLAQDPSQPLPRRNQRKARTTGSAPVPSSRVHEAPDQAAPQPSQRVLVSPNPTTSRAQATHMPRRGIAKSVAGSERRAVPSQAESAQRRRVKTGRYALGRGAAPSQTASRRSTSPGPQKIPTWAKRALFTE